MDEPGMEPGDQQTTIDCADDGATPELDTVERSVQQKLNQHDLRESEAYFRQLFELHCDVMLLIDHQSGIIVDANPAAAQFYGYPLEILRGMNVSRINAQDESAIHPQRQETITGEQGTLTIDHRLACAVERRRYPSG